MEPSPLGGTMSVFPSDGLFDDSATMFLDDGGERNYFFADSFLTPETSAEGLSEDSFENDMEVDAFTIPFFPPEDPILLPAIENPPSVPTVSKKRARRNRKSSPRATKMLRSSGVRDISGSVETAHDDSTDLVSLKQLLDAGIIGQDELDSITKRIRAYNKLSSRPVAVSSVEGHLSALRSQNASFIAENSSLKKLNSPVSKLSTIAQLLRRGADALTQSTSQKSRVKPGVVLLVILLSFGMIFRGDHSSIRAPVTIPQPSFKAMEYSTPILSSNDLVVEATPPSTPPFIGNEISASYHSILEWKANTTYLVCPAVNQLAPPADVKFVGDPNAEPQITFLIPPDTMEPSLGGDSSQEVMEVTCKVVGLAKRPLIRH